MGWVIQYYARRERASFRCSEPKKHTGRKASNKKGRRGLPRWVFRPSKGFGNAAQQRTTSSTSSTGRVSSWRGWTVRPHEASTCASRASSALRWATCSGSQAA